MLGAGDSTEEEMEDPEEEGGDTPVAMTEGCSCLPTQHTTISACLNREESSRKCFGLNRFWHQLT